MTKWHPYPQEKPTSLKEVLATIQEVNPKCTYISVCSIENDRFYDEEGIAVSEEKVIAWMEMPEPYKEE